MEVESEGKLPDSRTYIYAVSITREETITIHDHILRELTPLRAAFRQRILVVVLEVPQQPFSSCGINLKLVFYTISQASLRDSLPITCCG